MIQRSTHRSTPRSSARIVPFLILLALAFLATATLSVPRAAAQAPVDCLAPPPRNQDLTLVAAYAASPPAVDEIAFTMETENLMALTHPLKDIVAKGRLREIPGVGPAIADIIATLHRTGTHPTLEAMRRDVPASVLEMLTIPGAALSACVFYLVAHTVIG